MVGGFAAIRHTETGGVGTATADAMDNLRANGWVRVSEYRAEPGDFHLADYVDAPDLDAVTEPAPPIESKAKPTAKATKESA